MEFRQSGSKALAHFLMKRGNGVTILLTEIVHGGVNRRTAVFVKAKPTDICSLAGSQTVLQDWPRLPRGSLISKALLNAIHNARSRVVVRREK